MTYNYFLHSGSQTFIPGFTSFSFTCSFIISDIFRHLEIKKYLTDNLKKSFYLQDIFAVAVSLITGKIVYISDQAASILNCKREVFNNAKFVEFLTPQDVSVFYSFTTPYRLPSWSMCTGAGTSNLWTKISTWKYFVKLKFGVFMTDLRILSAVVHTDGRFSSSTKGTWRTHMKHDPYHLHTWAPISFPWPTHTHTHTHAHTHIAHISLTCSITH